MTAQAAKAAILRTIKLNGGAAYIWGAVKTIDTPDQYTLVFHLKYPSPLALEASADYSAYIYDTQAAGGGNALAKWLNAGHDAGTGPYTVQTWNKGQEFEVVLKAFPQVLGRLDGLALHQGRVPRRAAGHDGGQLLRAGQVTFVEQISPPLWESLKGDSASAWSARRPGRTCSPSSTSRRAEPAGPAGDLLRHRLQRHHRGAHGAGVASSGIVPPGLLGHFTDLPTTPTTRPRRRRC